MPIQIVQQDITRMTADVIVNPTDPRYSGSGGVDRQIHQAAGAEMDGACALLPPLNAGEVRETPGYLLSCGWVIHTVGPRWEGGENNEASLLRSCYVNALLLALRLNARSVAFPLISAGRWGFPKDQVLRLGLRAVSDFLGVTDCDLDVFFCVPDRNSYESGISRGLRRYLDAAVGRGEDSGTATADLNEGPGRSPFGRRNAAGENAVCAETAPAALPKAARTQAELPVRQPVCKPAARAARSRRAVTDAPAAPLCEEVPCGAAAAPEKQPTPDLREWLKQHDDSFAVTLLKLIDKKGMTEVECYKKANVSRKTFSKINTDRDYRPSKQTVIAFAIALELDLRETEQLLKTVGFSLSHSETFDLIIEFFITNRIYDVYVINEALYQYDQVCLG